MIQSLLNLICTNGHRYFSPTPQQWVAKECLSGQQGGVCRALIEPIYPHPGGKHRDIDNGKCTNDQE